MDELTGVFSRNICKSKGQRNTSLRKEDDLIQDQMLEMYN